MSFCAFNRCDSESYFVAKGKGRVSRLLMKPVVFFKTFKCIGNSCNVSKEGVKSFVYKVDLLVYSPPVTGDGKELQCKMYYSKRSTNLETNL